MIPNPPAVWLSKTLGAIHKVSLDPSRRNAIASHSINVESMTLRTPANKAPVVISGSNFGAIELAPNTSFQFSIPGSGKVDLSGVYFQAAHGDMLTGFYSMSGGGRSPIVGGGGLTLATNLVTTADATAGNFGAAGTTSSFEYIMTGNIARIKQAGTIRRVKFYFGLSAATMKLVTRLTVRIWRQDAGGNTWSLIGESDDLSPRLQSRVTQDLFLGSPIAGVREGDQYGIRVEVSSSPGAGNGLFSGQVRTGCQGYLTQNAASANRVEWTSLTAFADNTTDIPVECYMDAPTMVIAGDSIAAGHSSHYSYLETTNTNLPLTPMGYKVANAFGVAQQNYGIGGETTTQIAARVAAIVATSAKLAIINGGVNDISSGLVDQATFLANWTTILNALTGAGIKVCVLKIFPWSTGTNQQLTDRDSYNAALVSLVATSYANSAFCVDMDSTLGVNRGSGPVGNLWNMNGTYTSDGIHPNPAGYTLAAAKIVTDLNAFLNSKNLAL